jgi:hypothetical protein
MRYSGMMTRFFGYTLKILRPTLLAATISISAPVFGLVDQFLNGTASAIVMVNEPRHSRPANTTIIYKNSFFGT